MKIVKIPKRNGKFRTIYIPDDEHKNELKQINAQLLAKNDLSRFDFIHGFALKRNAVTNAKKHIGYRYTLSFDLKDFFESVTPDKIIDIVPKNIIDKVIADGATRQGLPTSPTLANLAFLPVDQELLHLLKVHNVEAVYTRYADDMAFSFNDINDKLKIENIINEVVPAFGFIINDSKTKLQDLKNGKKIITGLAVDSFSVSPTRETKRRLRAALHNSKNNQQNYTLYNKYKGLLEWSLCKEPRNKIKNLCDGSNFYYSLYDVSANTHKEICITESYYDWSCDFAK